MSAETIHNRTFPDKTFAERHAVAGVALMFYQGGREFIAPETRMIHPVERIKNIASVTVKSLVRQ